MTQNHTHWNYRVIRFEGDTHTIHEVYYDREHIVAWAESASAPFGWDREGLGDDMRLMAEAWDRPVLDWKDLPK